MENEVKAPPENSTDKKDETPVGVLISAIKERQAGDEKEAKAAPTEKTSDKDETPAEIFANDSTKSQLFKIVSICTLIVGFISGIWVLASEKSDVLIYSMGLNGSVADEIKLTLMFEIWISAIILFLLFWAIYCHLKNQEIIISKLEK